MQLEHLLIDHIQKNGPLSFRDFMETALYHPSLGYYSSAAEKIGPNSDYLTSPEISPLFGALIGRQIEQMWELTGKTPFTIVEFGAGNGKLCRDILAYLQSNPALYDKLSYYIVEKSQAMRKLEKQLLYEKVTWVDCITEIPPFTGCVISNELVDNLAVHQVVMKDELMEICIAYGEDGFVERLIPASDELKNYLAELNITLQRNFRTEINLDAKIWLQKIADSLSNGYVITIDYGGTSAEIYSPHRCDGTLMCFKKHKPSSDPYQEVGSRDITAHVNFSALSHFGKKYGLSNCGITTQASFLLGLGLTNFIRACEEKNINNNQHHAGVIQALVMDMGMKFKVLIQKKGRNNGEKLLGLSL